MRPPVAAARRAMTTEVQMPRATLSALLLAATLTLTGCVAAMPEPESSAASTELADETAEAARAESRETTADSLGPLAVVALVAVLAAAVVAAGARVLRAGPPRP